MLKYCVGRITVPGSPSPDGLCRWLPHTSAMAAGLTDHVWSMEVLPLPAPIRTRLCTTNSVERLNEEVRRRERVIRIFPNTASVECLLGAVLQEHDEAWTSGKRYLDLTGYWQWPQAQEAVRGGGRPLEAVRLAA